MREGGDGGCLEIALVNKQRKDAAAPFWDNCIAEYFHSASENASKMYLMMNRRFICLHFFY
jgi:hypothetical protein